ncbi:Dbl homology domain-containing protein [Thozetella sp. PMI_491]|nr:Dbl homology domain-containing protein [Thozetella sp. PMI_491]
MERSITNSLESPLENRQFHLIQELVQTESRFVPDIAELVQLQQTLVARQLVSPEDSKALFSNIGDIYALHSRFLAGIEPMVLDQLPTWRDKVDHLSALLVALEEDFQVYHPYIRSISRVDWYEWVRTFSDAVKATEFKRIDEFSLDGSLLRPFSRFVKYSVFMKDFQRYTTGEEARQALMPGARAMERIQERAMAVHQQAELEEAGKSLPNRVEDWDSCVPSNLGKLLRRGTHQVERVRTGSIKEVTASPI